MSQPPGNADRLHGWKEIAVHLGKSVRTAVRWEKKLGLPVHRLHTAGGEIVHASRREIDRWLVKAETRLEDDAAPTPGMEAVAPPVAAREATTGRRASGGWHLLLALGVLAAAGAGWLAGRTAARERGGTRTGPSIPVDWRVQDGRLRVFDAAGRELWTHAFGVPLHAASYDRHHARWGSQVSIEDVDGDGAPEVLAVPPGRPPGSARLHCFEGDGRLRFTRAPGRTVHFGSMTAEPPFGVSQFEVVARPEGAKAIWLSGTHHVWFPNVVEKLSPRGDVLGEFWMNGHVTAFTTAVARGRPVALVGATNNETGGAALVVLDQQSPSGSAPANGADYLCRDCPGGRPLAFLVFPRMDIPSDSQARAYVTLIRVRADGRVAVSIEQGTALLGLRPEAQPLVLYELDPAFRVVGAEVGDTFAQAHARLEALGRLDHAFGRRDEDELFPVLRWEEGRLEHVAAPRTAGPRSGIVRLTGR